MSTSSANSSSASNRDGKDALEEAARDRARAVLGPVLPAGLRLKMLSWPPEDWEGSGPRDRPRVLSETWENSPSCLDRTEPGLPRSSDTVCGVDEYLSPWIRFGPRGEVVVGQGIGLPWRGVLVLHYDVEWRRLHLPVECAGPEDAFREGLAGLAWPPDRGHAERFGRDRDILAALLAAAAGWDESKLRAELVGLALLPRVTVAVSGTQ